MEHFSSIILSGGNSTRIGQNKALLEVSGKTLIEVMVDNLKKISSKIYIVTDTPEEYTFFSNDNNISFVKDIFPEKKSILAAMYSGLKVSEENYNFICSCDLPYLNINLINYLYSLKSDFDAIIPIFNNEPKTLHAFYSKNTLKVMEKVLDKGNKKVSRIFRDLNIKYVPQNALESEDEKLLSFFSIKTYLDYMLVNN
ncbi:MAG: molybdenum cofactor guanylyltransferase [Candidatus Sericytochromatia bacterium]